jgi:hypothetical protein
VFAPFLIIMAPKRSLWDILFLLCFLLLLLLWLPNVVCETYYFCSVSYYYITPTILGWCIVWNIFDRNSLTDSDSIAAIIIFFFSIIFECMCLLYDWITICNDSVLCWTLIENKTSDLILHLISIGIYSWFLKFRSLIYIFFYSIPLKQYMGNLVQHLKKKIIAAIESLSSKSSGRTCSVSFRYKSLRHDWHTGDDKK